MQSVLGPVPDWTQHSNLAHTVAMSPSLLIQACLMMDSLVGQGIEPAQLVRVMLAVAQSTAYTSLAQCLASITYMYCVMGVVG